MQVNITLQKDEMKNEFQEERTEDRVHYDFVKLATYNAITNIEFPSNMLAFLCERLFFPRKLSKSRQEV